MSDAFRFEYKGESYQHSGDGGCRLCAAKGDPCTYLSLERQDHPCTEATTKQESGPNFVKVKFPEPTAPKSLSLEEILAEQEAKPSAPLKHDGHYRTLEAKGAEPIERMEALVCRGIPEDLHRIAKRNLNMAMASKHQDRAGEKSGESWEKELQKAENYLHRAWSGRWI